MVIALIAIALAAGWAIRDRALFRGQTVTVEELQLSLPAGSIATARGAALFTAITPTNLTVEVEVRPFAGPHDDVLALLTGQAAHRSQNSLAYRVLKTDVSTVDGRPAGILQFAYVINDTHNFFSSALDVIHGYELLVNRDARLYCIRLESTAARRELASELWPRLVRNLHFVERPR